MYRSMIFGFVLLALAVFAAPQPARGQSDLSKMTDEELQHAEQRERVVPFCEYLEESNRQKKPIPKGALAIPGIGNGKYVYTAGEVETLSAPGRCERLMKLFAQLAGQK